MLQCDVPQGSMLETLVFLTFVNDFKKSAKLFDLIMFVDDTNLFYIDKNIKVLFETISKQLQYVNEWFVANKLSLNAGKTKGIFFHKQSTHNSTALRFYNFQQYRDKT